MFGLNTSSPIFRLFFTGDVVGDSINFALLLASVVSWAIIFHAWISIRKAEAANRRFLTVFSKTEDLVDLQRVALKLNDAPMALLVQGGLDQISPYLEDKDGARDLSEDGNAPMRLNSLERTLQSAIEDEMGYRERYLHFLATIANTAPLIGLFGTILGIMAAFQEIGRRGSLNIVVIGPGIAVALTTTVAGLVAAIPANVAYNIFVQRLRKMEVQMNVLSSELINLIEEKCLKERGSSRKSSVGLKGVDR